MASRWIDYKVGYPEGYSQLRILMEALADRCVAETLYRSGDVDALCNLLSDAWSILRQVWYAITQPQYGRSSWETLWDINNLERFKGDKKQEILLEMVKAKRLLWKRVEDPLVAFKDGFSINGSLQKALSASRVELTEAVIRYLKNPYLRVSTFDWLLLDMQITIELYAYGYNIELKKRFEDSKVSYKKKLQVLWGALQLLWYNILLCFLIPIAIIYSCFYFGYETAGFWICGIYAVFASIYLLILGWMGVIQCIGFIGRVMRNFKSELTPREKQLELWFKMREVWKRMEGPLVHPGRVREAMVESSSQGAVWENYSWALIDRTIAHDSAMWIVETP